MPMFQGKVFKATQWNKPGDLPSWAFGRVTEFDDGFQVNEKGGQIYGKVGDYISIKDGEISVYNGAVFKDLYEQVEDIMEPTLYQLVREEVERAQKMWPPFNSAHEGFAVLLEELDELKAHVWMNQKYRVVDDMRKEAIQVAAMAIRFAIEVCNEQMARK